MLEHFKVVTKQKISVVYLKHKAMGGEGSIQPLLNNNKNLLRKKSFFKRDKSASVQKATLLKNNSGELAFEKVSDEDLEKIKSEIQSKAKRIDIINGIYATIAIIIICSLLTLYIRHTIKIDRAYKLQTEKLMLQEKAAKNQRIYDVYVEEATEQFEKRHWKNAIHFYKKALVKKPNDSLATIQLIQSETQLNSLSSQ